ncbi:MAG: AMP-binding protein [Vicinamibacterales bacterium]
MIRLEPGAAVNQGAGVSMLRTFRDEITRLIGARPDFPWLTLVSAGGRHVVTLGALGRRIEDYRAFYRMTGVRHGDLVLIVLKESIDLFASFFAAICHGAVPAYYAYPSPKQTPAAFIESLRHLLRHNRIRLVVTFKEVSDLLAMRREPSVPALDVVTPDRIAAVGASSEAMPPEAPARECFLQFSSGTTGAKKGTLISSDALFNQIEAYGPFVAFDADSRVVSWLPHYHDMGLIACMLMPFLRGVPVVMMSPFEWVGNPRLLLRAITEHRGTHVWLPNFALAHLFRSVPEEELDAYDLSTLRRLILCSELVQPETVRGFLDKFGRCGIGPGQLVNCYAMAENTFAVASGAPGMTHLDVDPVRFQREHRAVPMAGGRRLYSSGRPLPNVDLRLIDANGEAVGEDVVAEIELRSDCMLAEYHGNPEATREASDGPWLKTGDLGFLHDGELYVTGRAKETIIVGGENIYPQDIEQVLNEDPALAPGRNVAFGVEDKARGTERIVVLAELVEGATPPDEAALRGRLTTSLGVTIGEMLLLPPRTLRKGTAGKVSRYLNKQLYLNGGFAVVEPERALVDQVRQIVFELAPGPLRAGVGRETRLFETGVLDSFALAELVLRLEQGCGVRIPESEWSAANFSSIDAIVQALGRYTRQASQPAGILSPQVESSRHASLNRLLAPALAPRKGPLMERVINSFPLRGSIWYRWLLRMAGIRVGRGVRFLGGVRVKLRGRPENIVLSDGVVLGDGVDLRIRENGRIHLGDRVYLDDGVRIVAARDGAVEIGVGTELGPGTIINSGGTTRIGRFAMIAARVSINSSTHGTSAESYIKEQPHTHGAVEIGDDVWIGAGASILVNTRIGNGAVVASNSLAIGWLREYSVSAGVPAQVIRYR